MELKLNSGLFEVLPPCCYWVFGDYLREVEAQEQQDYDGRREERIDVVEHRQRWLPGLPIKKRHGQTAYTSIARKDLPHDHIKYVPEVVCELDWEKAKTVIAQAWLKTFEDCVVDRLYTESMDRLVTVVFDGTWSPREYNFSHDSCEFTAFIHDDAMRRIIRYCLEEHRERFGAYVKEHYSSRDGFASFTPNSVRAYDELYERFEAGDVDEHTKRLCWVALNFWLFGAEHAAADWDESLWRHVDDCTDGLCNAFEYTPVETDAAV